MAFPTAITQAASNIRATIARINGKITDDGGESCEARFRWRKKGGTEEQTAYSAADALYNGDVIRLGQRLTISNRTVTKLAFFLCKVTSPTGDVTFTIRKVSDDSIIQSEVWGDASNLPTDVNWEEAEFTSPTNINEEVRILCEYAGGDSLNYVRVYDHIQDEKANEYETLYISSYTDQATWDGTYKYTYVYDWTTTEWQNTLVTNDTYYADLTALDDLTEYEFQTQAKNSAGEGEWSASAYFETRACQLLKEDTNILLKGAGNSLLLL